jgi:hypothetical protein
MDTPNSILKIVIVYENLFTGIKAGTVLMRLDAQLEAEFEIDGGDWQMDSGAWRFEMLGDPELQRLAVAEAVEADMIIISVGDSELPACVRSWIEQSLPLKDGRPVALVALLDRGNDTFSEPSPPETYLRRLAGQYGLDYFCKTHNQILRNASGFEPNAARAEGDTAVWRTH